MRGLQQCRYYGGALRFRSAPLYPGPGWAVCLRSPFVLFVRGCRPFPLLGVLVSRRV